MVKFQEISNGRTSGSERSPTKTRSDTWRIITLSTPRKTNMEPKNHPCEKEKHLPNLNFLGSMLNFEGVSG